MRNKMNKCFFRILNIKVINLCFIYYNEKRKLYLKKSFLDNIN